VSDPDLAKVRVFLLCAFCGSERVLDVPATVLDRGKLSILLPCASCGQEVLHRLNPLKLPAEDA
jgi:transcription elongation factor Elf1